MKTPKLTLVGAGPGDPELITLKGIKALKSADVVLFDALISPKLLDWVQPNAEKIFVGKRRGSSAYQQVEINALIVEKALDYGHVVRLKGGDPFVFGQGADEIDYVKPYNIRTEVIPGVSSVTGVSAHVGIALTQRGVAESFWVITGTTKSGQLSNDIHLAAQSTATVVILMGMYKLNEIIATFMLEGRENTPIAIVQNGTLPNEQVVLGTISSIQKQVDERKIGTPALIIVGAVVERKRAALQISRTVLVAQSANPL